MGFLRAWRVRCPVCGAKPHNPCRRSAFRGLWKSLGFVVHQSRLEAALARRTTKLSEICACCGHEDCEQGSDGNAPVHLP